MTEGEGVRRNGMVSRTPCPARRAPRGERSRGSREGNSRREARRERRTDPFHLLKCLEGAERSVQLALRDDAGGERRPDPRELVQLRGAGAVQVDRWRARTGRPWTCRGRCGPDRPGGSAGGSGGSGGSPRLAPVARSRGSATPAAGDGGIDRGDLSGERLPVARGHVSALDRSPSSHAEPERRHRGHEEQRASFRWGRHPSSSPRRSRPSSPKRCLRRQISRRSVMATSPTSWSVRCETLSTVSSGV